MRLPPSCHHSLDLNKTTPSNPHILYHDFHTQIILTLKPLPFAQFGYDTIDDRIVLAKGLSDIGHGDIYFFLDHQINLMA